MENYLNESVKIFATEDSLYRYAARDLVLLINEFISNKGTCTIVLSGGGTPGMLYMKIGNDFADSVDWDKVFIFWGDERCVPPEDEKSNYKAGFNNLISKIKIPERNIFRIHCELPPEEAALNYENTLKSFFTGEKFPSFNIILLGIGSDGHTASLFPESDALVISSRWVVENYYEKLNTWRVTMTFPVLNNAKNIIFLAKGKEKASVIRKIFNDKKITLPAQKVKPTGGKLFWYLDKKAAGEIN